jgi:hypothetical protein
MRGLKMTKIFEYDIGDLHIQIHEQTSGFLAYPCVEIKVPRKYKVIGGGARVNWQGYGNLLTAMYPESERVWVAKSKDHKVPSPATITGYCICAKMRNGARIPSDDYRIDRKDSTPAQHPFTELKLPYDWELVGGGALANWGGYGSLLYASYPRWHDTWMAASKDHIHPEVSTVTAFAIGIKKSFLEKAGLEITHKQTTSKIATAHPSAQCALSGGFRLVCGGAKTNWRGYGNLLTASYPKASHVWEAKGKDHDEPDHSTITAWCIGIRPE